MKKFLLLVALAACSPGLGGYPCSKDAECPTGSVCGSGGKCEVGPSCGAGLTLCHACVSLLSDAANCGQCDKACPGDPNGTGVCSSGTCGISCAQGFTLVQGVCIGPAPAPAGLSATGARGSVSLSWSAAAGANQYKVERGSSPGGPYTLLETVSNTAYTDNTPAAGTTYYYVVLSVNAAGDGAPSNEASALTAPAAPTDLTATPGSGQISLSWIAPSSATAYAIQRSTTSGGPYSAAGTSGVSTYTDTGLLDGTSYFYVVIASNASGASLPSAELKATTRSATAGPTGLTATGTLSAINLTWDPVASATSYDVYRSTSASGSFSLVGSGAGASLHDVSGIIGSSDYYYQVAAVVGGLEGGASTIAVPAAPVSLAATGTPSSVALTWTGSTVATSYTVNRGSTSGAYDTNFATSEAHYTDETAANQEYFYQVQATAQGAVRNSVELAAPGAPTGFSASLPLSGNVPLSWTAAAGATGYHVLRAAGGAFAAIDQGAPLTATAYTDTDASVTSAQTFQYEAAAVLGNATRASALVTLYAAPAWTASTADDATAALAWGTVAGSGGSRLERATAASGPFAQVGALFGSPSASDTGLDAATEYWYQLRSYDAASSSYGLPSAVLHFPARPDAPGVEGGLGSVQVSWTGGAGAASFEVIRSGTHFAGAMSPYLDTDAALSNTQAYDYSVNALDDLATRTSASSHLAAAPSFTASTSEATIVNLAWTSTTGAYSLYVASVPGGPWTSVYGNKATTETSASFTGASPSAVYYRVQSVAPGSMYSDPIAIPAAPAPSAVGTPSSIALSWTGSGVESSWQVERGTSSGNYGAPQAVSQTNLTDAVASAAYFYRVTAAGPMASRRSAELAVPSARTLGQTSGDSSGVALNWTAGSEGTPVTLSSILLLRGTSPGGEAVIGSLDPAATSTTDAPAAGTAFYYLLLANAGQASRYSAEMLLPELPVLTQANGWSTAVQLGWTGSAHAAGYSIFRGGALVGSAAAGAVSYSDSPLSPLSYTYSVRAGADLYRDSSPLTVPAPPTGLSVTAGGTTAQLTWNPSADATGWRVFRSVTPGGEPQGAPVATVATSSYTDSGLAVGTTYYYVVQATNANVQSIQSSESSPATTFIAAPTGLAGSQSNHNVQLTWTPSEGATSYIVSRASASTGPYTQVGTPAGATFNETLGGAIATAYYQVVATDGAHPSAAAGPLTVSPRQFCVLNTNSGTLEAYDETQANNSVPLASRGGIGGSGGNSNYGLVADLSTQSIFFVRDGNLSLTGFPLPLGGATQTTISATNSIAGSLDAHAGTLFVPIRGILPGKVNWYNESNGTLISSLALPSQGSPTVYDAHYDATTNELFVLNSSTTTPILVYDFGTGTLKRSGGPSTAFLGPFQLAIDAVNDKLYVVDNSTVYRFPRTWTGTGATLTAINTYSGASRPSGISVDALGGVVRIANVNCGDDKLYILPLDLSGTATNFTGSGWSTGCGRGPSAITLCN